MVAPVENADLNNNNCSAVVDADTVNNSYAFFETNSNFQEYLHRSRYHLPNAPAMLPYTSDIGDGGDLPASNMGLNYSFDTSLLFYIFLIFDAFLFVYRCYSTYHTIRILRHGTEVKVTVGVVEIKHQRLGATTQTELDNLRNQMKHKDGSMHDMMEDDPLQTNVTLQKDRDGQPSRPGRGPSVLKSGVRCVTSCLNSYLLPKVLLAVTVGCFASLLVQATDKLLTVDLVDSYDGFQRYAVAMDINQNLTNKYVAEQAEYLNTAGVASFSRQMRQELRGLLTVKENFNLEQVSIPHNCQV